MAQIRKQTKLAKHTKDLPRVEVIWEDAAVQPDFDGKLDALPTTGTCINRTIGYLARATKKELHLVRDLTDEDNTVRWPYAIPHKLIKEIIFLRPESLPITEGTT